MEKSIARELFKTTLKKEYSNFRVIVYLPAAYNYQGRKEDYILADGQKACEEVRSQIKRHVDNVQFTEAHWETHATCSYCGLTPDCNETTGMPQCCDKAQTIYDKWAEKQDWITECLQAGCVCLTVVDGTCTECGAKEK